MKATPKRSIKQLANRGVDTSGKPPKDVKPSKVFQRLIARGPIGDVVDYEPTPGDKYTVRINVLTTEEQDACRTIALERCRKKGMNADDPNIEHHVVFQDDVALEILWRAVRDPEPVDLGGGRIIYNPAFASADEIRKLTPSEVVKLFNLYLIVQAKYDIDSNAQAVAENFDEWVKVVAEAADAAFLHALPSPLLVEILQGMAKELVNIWNSPSYKLLDTSESNQETSDSNILSSIVDASEQSQQLSKRQALEQALAKDRKPITKDEAMEAEKQKRKG